jgi:hypothetical protein
MQGVLSCSLQAAEHLDTIYCAVTHEAKRTFFSGYLNHHHTFQLRYVGIAGYRADTAMCELPYE